MGIYMQHLAHLEFAVCQNGDDFNAMEEYVLQWMVSVSIYYIPLKTSTQSDGLLSQRELLQKLEGDEWLKSGRTVRPESHLLDWARRTLEGVYIPFSHDIFREAVTIFRNQRPGLLPISPDMASAIGFHACIITP